ncbi:(2Fe-2S)-binding protein [Rhizobium rosettiformans]|uniref:(2Fe-2S)-binding protein n=1 Tax=Rhizobium rosettiformans TaxID=1368430 RepID=UPI00286414B7|nr:2Fe-2S iron-sulfur cluster-binding protein [Rhizobium rosettiformans]MDR7031149.1 aerobic-type carbon monoxide dehydrogenase small subunit (CoxS/CutS family) [Rhizobium rosettiformans]MDR7067054.1 aerobic-type carbon monoxide dehydrogenase small subunit (CoxS/CutS family) [Rhizobium rosettiformans]MDX5362335.1 (2Fe-2S)-binding protein [Alphaproteobacteria bacterium]
MRILLNTKAETIPDDLAEEPLLFVLRDHFGLNGPKFGCGVSSCGACTVVVDGEAQRSCLLPAGSLDGKAILTLEGLSAGAKLHPFQQSWIAESVPQCGYCQNGQIMTAYALLAARPEAGADDIAEAMDGVLCRCGTQARIHKAIIRAQAMMREER